MCAVRRVCALFCKWCATPASGLLHRTATSCTLGSNHSFRSGCAWATMDQQLQQHQQLLELVQASGSGSAGASSRPLQASRSGSQASGSSGVTAPKKPQVDEKQRCQRTEQPSPPRLQPHFPCKSELLVRHSCHMDAQLADDSFKCRSLRDVIPIYLYRCLLCHMLNKCRQVELSGIITYPWPGSAQSPRNGMIRGL